MPPSSSSNSDAVVDSGPQPWQLTVKQVAQEYKTDIVEGLSDEAAHKFLVQYGENTLGEQQGVNYGLILFHQFFNAMILVLFISMIITLAIRDWISGGVIGAVVLINISIGFWQEVKAERTMGALRILSSPTAHVTREGQNLTIPAAELVPGDLVHVSVGDTLPADIRLLESVNFETDEAMLTGESLPVVKDCDVVHDQATPVGVGDRKNMAYSSSIVSKGRTSGICVATGLNTEIGKIAQSLRGKKKLVRKVESSPNSDSKGPKQYAKAWGGTVKDWAGYFLGVSVGTPLQRKLSWLAIVLFWVAVIFAIVVMASQRMDVTKEVAIYAICVALSMIPSALIVVLTITMAVGSRVMVTKNVIVRKLDSLEALGGINAICSDKTGTLTQGKMVVKKVWIPSVGTYSLGNNNDPYNPELGDLSMTPHSPMFVENSDEGVKYEPVEIQSPQDYPENFQKWLYSATLANIATLHQGEHGWVAQGDATEIAIQVFCTRVGFSRTKITEENKLKSVIEFPFDSSIKRMSAVWQLSDGVTRVYTKGAVERILKICDRWTGFTEEFTDTQELRDLTKEDIILIEQNMEALSSQGLRVLAFASRDIENSNNMLDSRDNVESNLIFHGLVGIYDPPRLETARSVKLCHDAGINVHMLTGDHASTAKAIARDVGIIPRDVENYSPDFVKSMTMVAHDFDALTDKEIDALPLLPLVVARCAPQTKVRMIEALHRRRQYCAMTGDGVNDSPSLKMADVGIAMGINGSDVAKDASDIVLTDDNFASILNAIEEGRRMASNIQKFVLQLLAENVAQAIFLLVGLAFFDESGFSVFPLSPVEVLWILVITSCFPAMGLGQERASRDILQRAPNRHIFTRDLLLDMGFYGLWMAACCMATFVVVVYGRGDGDLGTGCNTDSGTHCGLVFRARAATFVTMTWCALILAWECIHPTNSLFNFGGKIPRPWWKQTAEDLWGNQLLFWSVIGGTVTVFPIVYIPVINDKVFLHQGIGWEWGLAVGFSIVYLLGSELWKYGKRVISRRWGTLAQSPEVDLEKSDHFQRYNSMISRSSCAKGEARITYIS